MDSLYRMEEITATEFQQFTKEQSYGFPLQSMEWGEVKKGLWSYFFIGLFDDRDHLRGAGLVLVLPVIRTAYLPRGPVLCDWDEISVKSFTVGMRSILRKHRISFYTIDPMIVRHCTACGKHSDEIFNPWENCEEEFERISRLFAENGLIHQGFDPDLYRYNQPRFNVFVPLAKKDQTPFTQDELKQTFHPKTKGTLGAFHTNRGISFEKVEATPENVRIFSEFVQMTGKRKDLIFQNEAYLLNLCRSLGENAALYFAYCHIPTYLAYLDATNRSGDAYYENLRQTQAEKGDRVIICAILHGFPPNEHGIRIADYWFSGMDKETFRHSRAVAGLLFFSMEDCIKRGCQFLDLGGIDRARPDTLLPFKSRFNSLLLEFGGEWEGAASTFWYKAAKGVIALLEIQRKINRFFRQIIKRFKKSKTDAEP